MTAFVGSTLGDHRRDVAGLAREDEPGAAGLGALGDGERGCSLGNDPGRRTVGDLDRRRPAHAASGVGRGQAGAIVGDPDGTLREGDAPGVHEVGVSLVGRRWAVRDQPMGLEAVFLALGGLATGLLAGGMARGAHASSMPATMTVGQHRWRSSQGDRDACGRAEYQACDSHCRSSGSGMSLLPVKARPHPGEHRGRLVYSLPSRPR